jgi:hypothetical protein
MSEFITLPDYKNHLFELEEDSIKMAIATYLMQFSSDYTVKRGDKVQIDIKFFEKLPDINKKSDKEITLTKAKLARAINRISVAELK